MIVGWIAAAAFVEHTGKDLYGDPFLYLYPTDRREILPFVLSWLPSAFAVFAASLPWILLALLDRRRADLDEKPAIHQTETQPPGMPR
jgi:hypothetical protein